MRRLIESILIRYDDVYVPVRVRIWQAEKAEFTAICFHQYFGSSQEFEAFAEICVRQNITVVAPDCPGRLPSGYYRAAGGYNVPFFLRYFLQICERYQAHKTVLVGYGFGGNLCLAAVRARFVKPFRVVLQDTPLRSTDYAERVIALTKNLSSLSHENPWELGKLMLDQVENAGFGRFGPSWVASLMQKKDNMYISALDPHLANSGLPEFDFVDFVYDSPINIGIFTNIDLKFEPIDGQEIAYDGIIRPICTFNAGFSPGFELTASRIIEFCKAEPGSVRDTPD